MSTKRKAVTNDEQARNDLRRIDGLGPKSAKTLLALGIGNCADLAQYLTQHSAKELSESLAEQGVQVAAKKIENEDWLGQARKQAVQANGEPATPKKDSRVAEEGDKGPARRSSSPDEVRFGVRFWRENGCWKVITYDERLPLGYDKTHGTDPAEWASWILDQMRREPELEFPLTESWTPTIPEFAVKILDARHYEAERFKKLAAEVRFEVSGKKKDALAQARTPFWIHVHAVELKGEQSSCVASMRGELEPEVFTYEHELEYPIPEVGRYQLCSLVLFLPPIGKAALCQGPTLKVTP